MTGYGLVLLLNTSCALAVAPVIIPIEKEIDLKKEENEERPTSGGTLEVGVNWEIPTVEGIYTHPRRRVCAPPPDGTCEVQQHFAGDVNINDIVARAKRGQTTTHINPRQPLYGDFTNAGDLRDMMDRVLTAEANFAALPSNIREWAQNDPVLFLHKVSEASEDELRQLEIIPQDTDTQPAPKEPTEANTPPEKATDTQPAPKSDQSTS